MRVIGELNCRTTRRYNILDAHVNGKASESDIGVGAGTGAAGASWLQEVYNYNRSGTSC